MTVPMSHRASLHNPFFVTILKGSKMFLGLLFNITFHITQTQQQQQHIVNQFDLAHIEQ